MVGSCRNSVGVSDCEALCRVSGRLVGDAAAAVGASELGVGVLLLVSSCHGHMWEEREGKMPQQNVCF